MYETAEELDAFFKALYKYEKVRLLGEGGFGLAVLAYDKSEQIHKVFKLPKTEQTTDALKIEGTNLVKLRDLLHRNIIQLHDYGWVEIEWHGKVEERHYLCLAFGGMSLRGKLGPLKVSYDADGNPSYHTSGGTRLEMEEGLRIAIDVCHGLEAAHGFQDSEVRIIHRDIKPGNILIDDETGVGRITDFGISRVVDRSTGIASVAGTLLYMDPECFKGKAGVWSDIYSFGLVMYEMFTGRLPFSDFPSRLDAHAEDPRTYNPAIPEALARVILKALEPHIEDRYASASEVLADLRKASAVLNPLPPRYQKIEAMGAGCYVCRDLESEGRVRVQLVECDVSLGVLADEARALQGTGTGVLAPMRHFRNEQVLGIVWPAPRGRALTDALGGVPVRGTGLGGLTRFCRVIASLCDLVADAHAAGVVHGHLSPQLVWCEGEDRLTVHGFGVGPVLRGAPHGSAGERSAGVPSGGTPGDASVVRESFRDHLSCMSPQMLEGGSGPTPADDVFSLGALMYMLLTGHAVADDMRTQTLGASDGGASKAAGSDASGHGPSGADLRSSNDLVSHRLASIVLKAIAPDPDARYVGVKELADDLRRCRWPEDLIETLTEDALGTYEQGSFLRACEMLEGALEADPGNARVHYTRGVIYFRENEYRWAVDELTIAAGVDPTREVFVLLGRCYTRWGAQHDRAAEAFTRALTCGDDAEVRQLLAEALWQQDKRDEAMSQMERAIALTEDASVRQRYESVLQKWRGP